MSDAPFRFPMQVRFQDTDAAGIVFYARVFDFFHDAYAALLTAAGAPLHQVIARREWAAPLVHAEADYVAPLRFGDEIDVLVGPCSVDAGKLVNRYRIVGRGEPASARPKMTGSTVHIYVDPRTFQRTAIPDALIQSLRTLTGSTEG